MSITSNLYANHILTQHPIAVWTLDESLSGTTVNLGSSGTIDLYAASTVNAYEASTYNYTGQTGYYISGNVSNTSFPIIYGSYNSTLAKSINSIILPAFGFLNSKGKNNTYTLETWLKIPDPYVSGTRKLIGCFIDYASESDDNNGLYFNQTSFILRIGDNYGTHYVKDFNKPMLIQLSYSNNAFSLSVNSEIVIELSLTTTDTALLKETSKNYIMLSNALFDSAALYNYILERNQSKLNYSKALNTLYPTYLINRYDGKGFKIDYRKAKYSNSIKFPTDLSGQAWKSGFSNHIDINNSISILPYKYNLPTFNFSDTKITKKTLETAGSPTFQFKKLSSTWVSSEANIQFDSLNILRNDKIKAFYLDTTFATLPATEQIVFKIIHKSTKEYFKISMDSTNIYYKFKSGTNAEVTLKTQVIFGLNFWIGIDIDKFVSSFPTTKTFFNNLANLSVYVAGEENLAANTTFTGLINSVKFLNSFNLAQRTSVLGSLVTSFGTFLYNAGLTSLNSILGSYDLDLFYNSILSKYYFTVGTSGYWKNHIPLQSLAAYTTNASGVKSYIIDFIQFNIDYAAPTTKTQVGGNWIFDTVQSNPHLKSYITFENGIDTYLPDSDFTTQAGPNINRVVKPGSGDTWKTTKYEVVDDFIIYMPDNIDISTYYLMATLEMSIPDTLNNDLEIKSLEFLSKTLSQDTSVENPVEVSQGSLVPYTYTLSGATKVYNYRTKNPFIVNKNSHQYLQLSRQSGIRLVGDYTGGEYRGIRYKINTNNTLKYNISTLQMFVFYEGLATRTGSTITKSYFPTTATEVFQIQSRTRNFKFYIQSTNPGVDDTQGKISSLSNTGIVDDNIVYYINGQFTTNPIINANEWTVIGVVFVDKLDFNSYSTGYLDFTGPMSFDNISFYQLKKSKYTQSTIYRTWAQVQTPIYGTGTYTWNSWIANTWGEVQLTGGSTATAANDMGQIYKEFVGNDILVTDAPKGLDLAPIDELHIVYDAIARQTSTYSVS